METNLINSDWKKLVIKERVEGLNSSEKNFLDDPDIHLAIFNNITLATSLGLLSVLKHLIEDMSMDINGYYAFRCGIKLPNEPILTSAIEFFDFVGPETLNYLLSVDKIDVSIPITQVGPEATASIARLTFDPRYSRRCFEAILRHKSFDPSRVVHALSYDGNIFHDFCSFFGGHIDDQDITKEERDISIAKVKVIIEMGPGVFNWEWSLRHASKMAEYFNTSNHPNTVDLFASAREELWESGSRYTNM